VGLWQVPPGFALVYKSSFKKKKMTARDIALQKGREDLARTLGKVAKPAKLSETTTSAEGAAWSAASAVGPDHRLRTASGMPLQAQCSVQGVCGVCGTS